MNQKAKGTTAEAEGKAMRLAVIGSTGSIGTQTLDIVDHYPGLYDVAVLAAGTRVDSLIEQARKFRPRLAVIARQELLPRLQEGLAGLDIETAAGAQAIADAVSRPYVDTVVTATVGYSGLQPTISAIKAGKDIALANKETLVVAGSLINRLLEKSESRIFPVDSEHSAVAQCLAGEDINSVDSLLITASGGPFRLWDAKRLEKATVEDALRHPNWQMGAKITVDCATMMNKAFELIEAHYLFGVAPERIRALVHPQSIVHSMVQFRDGAIKAQLGVPDMRLPIAYALGCNKRLDNVAKTLTLHQLSTLTFEEPDTEKFPCLTLAPLCMSRGGNTACVVNAANEIANQAFRNGTLAFGSIYPVVAETLEYATYVETPQYDDFVQSNNEARRIAAELVERMRSN